MVKLPEPRGDRKQPQRLAFVTRSSVCVRNERIVSVRVCVLSNDSTFSGVCESSVRARARTHTTKRVCVRSFGRSRNSLLSSLHNNPNRANCRQDGADAK